MPLILQRTKQDEAQSDKVNQQVDVLGDYEIIEQLRNSDYGVNEKHPESCGQE
jgi:hypothetical protein